MYEIVGRVSNWRTNGVTDARKTNLIYANSELVRRILDDLDAREYRGGYHEFLDNFQGREEETPADQPAISAEA